MAVAKMKKVYIIAHRHDEAAIVGDLQEAGLIEVGEIETDDSISKGADEELFAARAEQLGLELTKIQFVLDFLKKGMPSKTGFISSLVKERFVIDGSRFHSIDKKLDFEELYRRCLDIDGGLTEIARERTHETGQRAELAQWSGLGVRFEDLKPTRFTGISVGRCKRNDLERLEEHLAGAGEESEIAFEGGAGVAASLVILYFKPHKAAIERALSAGGFEFVDLTGWKATPEEESAAVDVRLTELKEEESRLRGDISELVAYREDVMILHDWLKSRRLRYETQSRFGQTTSTFLLQGWVDAANAAGVGERLGRLEAVADFTFSDPEPDDIVPIVLRNNRWIRPFEVLTRLYGVPDYHELDPTPTMGVFFFVFFGIALGDFGYGLVLALFCLWLGRKLLLTEMGRLWLDVFILGGVSSMLFGVLTGSYFGIDTKLLPHALRSLMVIDPLSQAFIFLVITWVIGVIHIMTGLALEFIDAWRNRDYAGAVYDNLSLIAVVIAGVASLAGWMATTVFASKAPIYKTISAVGVQALGISALVYVLFSGGFFSGYLQVGARLLGLAKPEEGQEKKTGDILAGIVLLAAVLALFVNTGPVPMVPIAVGLLVLGLARSSATRRALGELGAGLYNLYGMSALIGDILSYSRLMALGLATFLIGFVINTLAGLVAGISVAGLPIGILLALLIAIPLHIVNLVINLLGAFVHPLRLQFVEYFSKFYEDGGTAFRPFGFETENLIIRKESGV